MITKFFITFNFIFIQLKIVYVCFCYLYKLVEFGLVKLTDFYLIDIAFCDLFVDCLN